MRVAFISDIHANFEALQAILPLIRKADVTICLGDLVGYYCQVNEVIDAVRAVGAISLRGNHDDFVLRGGAPTDNLAVSFGVEYAARAIRPDNRKWLAELPLMQGIVLDGRSLLLTHGSPWSPLKDYLYADLPAIQELNDFDFDIIAFGQTHRRLLQSGQRPLILNPGSVGQSRDVVARARATIVDTTRLSAEFIDEPYSASKVIELAQANGAGPWVSKNLLDA